MNNQLIVVFLSVFVAEIGDKTQLATMLFATEQHVSSLKVFLAAASALVLSSALAVIAGATITRFIPVSALKILAGSGFVIIGVWTLLSAHR